MIIITTSSSISVKPRCSAVRRLPVMVMHPVQPLARGERVDVVDVLAGLRIIGRTRKAAQPPGIFPRHGAVWKEWIARHAAQEVHHYFLFARLILNAHVQRFQLRRVAGGAQLLDDVAGVARQLVGIERGADVTQRRAQLGLLLALGHQLRERHRGGGHESYDRQRDDELDKGEAARAHGLQCCAAAWIAIFSGGAELLPTAAPAPPSTFIMAMMLVAGRAATALNCSTIRLPLPCTGSSEVVVTSSCAPLPRVSTFGLPAAAGTMSPGLALTSCSALESKRSCERRCVID